MAFVAEKVKIDVEYINDYLKRHNIRFTKFSESLGFCNNWWSKNSQHGYIKPNVAKLMCTVYPLEYDKLVIPEEKPQATTEDDADRSKMNEEAIALIAQGMKATSDALKEVHNALERLNEKMDTMLALWN